MDGLKAALALSGNNLAGRQVRVSVAEPRKSDQRCTPFAVYLTIIQPKIDRMLAILVTGHAKVHSPIYHKTSDESLSDPTLGPRTSTIFRMPVAIAGIVVGLNKDREMERTGTSRTGREEALYHHPQPLQLLFVRVEGNKARMPKVVSARIPQPGERVALRMVLALRGENMLKNQHRNDSPQHPRWTINGALE